MNTTEFTVAITKIRLSNLEFHDVRKMFHLTAENHFISRTENSVIFVLIYNEITFKSDNFVTLPPKKNFPKFNLILNNSERCSKFSNIVGDYSELSL